MNQTLYIFLFTGLVSMSAALSAGALNKLPEAERPAWMQIRNRQVMIVLAGNLAALTLVAAMAYGFLTLHWSIPLSSMFISFPLVHVALIQRLLGEARALLLMMPLVLVAVVTLYVYWP